LHPGSERRNGHCESETKKIAKTFFFFGSWKKQKAAYLCTPLQPEADLLKNELLSNHASKKSFSERLAE